MIYRIRLIPKRVVEYVSPASLAMTGYTPEEMMADPDLITSLTHPDDRALADYFIRDHPEARGPFIVRWIRRDGAIVWTERFRVPIEDDQGRIVMVQGVVRDITDRMRAEQELESLRRDFLGMVSHELKTPLTAIKGAAAMVLGSEHPISSEDTRDLFQIINEQADKLRDLVDSLLDITRIEANSFNITTEPTDLLVLVEKLRSTLQQSTGWR
jgi:PAS domain S-box-containing protein